MVLLVFFHNLSSSCMHVSHLPAAFLSSSHRFFTWERSETETSPVGSPQTCQNVAKKVWSASSCSRDAVGNWAAASY